MHRRCTASLAYVKQASHGGARDLFYFVGVHAAAVLALPNDVVVDAVASYQAGARYGQIWLTYLTAHPKSSSERRSECWARPTCRRTTASRLTKTFVFFARSSLQLDANSPIQMIPGVSGASRYYTYVVLCDQWACGTLTMRSCSVMRCRRR